MMNYMLLVSFCSHVLAVPQSGYKGAPSGQGLLDPSILEEVFGTGSNTGGYDETGRPLPSTNDGSQAGIDKGYNTVKEVVDLSSNDCSYFKKDGYSCVPYYSCEAGEIITDGGGLIDIRSNFGILDPSSSKCPGYLDVCCRHPDVPKKTTPTTKAPPPPYVPQCGRRNTGGVSVRIQNDKYKESTQFGEWPHMCVIFEKKTELYGESINLYKCGASLVAPGIVLTAAHCIEKNEVSNLIVRCGEWNTQEENEPQLHEDIDVKTVILDPLFNPKNLQNDFALVFLKYDFVLKPHIDTICLPNTVNGIYSYRQKNCVVTGWGKDKFGKKGKTQVILKQIEMNTVANDVCQRAYRNTRLGSNFILDDSFICAGGEKNKDACQKDGGGPLVCPVGKDRYGNPAHYVQAGIVAWGLGCGTEGLPGVYASVSSGLCFMEWATQCQGTTLNIRGCENYENTVIDFLNSEILKAGRLGRKRAATLNRALLKNFNNNQCRSNSGGGYGGDLDLSGLQRAQAPITDTGNYQ